MAEGGGLLNRYTVNIRIVGSNPIPSATCAAESLALSPEKRSNPGKINRSLSPLVA